MRLENGKYKGMESTKTATNKRGLLQDLSGTRGIVVRAARLGGERAINGGLLGKTQRSKAIHY